MALIKCKECGNEVSTKAESCPKCGAKTAEGTSFLVWLVLLVVIVVSWGVVFDSPDPKPLTKEQQQALAERKKREAEQQKIREAYAVARYDAEAAVKARLKDPESAKFSRVVVRPNGAVCGYVNAKNGFGGYTGEMGFITTGSPEHTSIDSGSGPVSAVFRAAWDAACIDQPEPAAQGAN